MFKKGLRYLGGSLLAMFFLLFCVGNFLNFLCHLWWWFGAKGMFGMLGKVDLLLALVGWLICLKIYERYKFQITENLEG